MRKSRSSQSQQTPSSTEPKPRKRRRQATPNERSAAETSTATQPRLEPAASAAQVPTDEELSAFIAQLKRTHRSPSTAEHTQPRSAHTNGEPASAQPTAEHESPHPAPTPSRPRKKSRRARNSPPPDSQQQPQATAQSHAESEQKPDAPPTHVAPSVPPANEGKDAASASTYDSPAPSKHRHKHRHKKPNLTPAPQQPTQQQSQQTKHTPQRQEVPPPATAKQQTKPKRPARTFVVRDLVRMPDIPDECIPILEQVERTLDTELNVEAGATILVAVSGGIDSIALLDILYILSYEHGYGLHVAHVNHQLRGTEANRDDAFVRSIAKSYDLPCHVTHVDTQRFARSHRLSIEEAARELRYRFLRQVCSSVHARYCAIAHTADDTAETLLLNLFRGTGLTGLAAIPPKRPLTKKAYLIRPLLSLSREDIHRYATARSLQWIEDSSNTDRRFARNRIRHEVLPSLKENFNRRIVETLARTAQLMRQADGFIESLIESTYAQVARSSDGRVELDRTLLAHLHPFVQGEIVERALTELTGNRPVSHAAVERVLSLLHAETGTRQNVIASVSALADRDSIVLCDVEAVQTVYLPIFKLGTYSIGRYTITLEEVERNDVRMGADPAVEYFDYDRLPYRLFLRTWHAGDRIAPIGMNGHHILVADFLTNAKVSDHDRRTAVVLATADDIVWLCGYRMSEHYKLTNETRRIIRATFRRS